MGRSRRYSDNESAPVTLTAIPGDSIAPAAVTGLTAEGKGRRAKLTWTDTAVPSDYLHYDTIEHENMGQRFGGYV